MKTQSTRVRISRFIARIKTPAGASRAARRLYHIALRAEDLDTADGLIALADALHYRKLELNGLALRDWKLQQDSRAALTRELNRALEYFQA